jgi:NAD(P)-dependent dehydrogenase (short-subunit alcohol dehydrogenase family)
MASHSDGRAMPSFDNDPFKEFRLSRRVALVTGGSRGLGREMILAFAKAGADVVIVSRKIEACQAVVNEVREVANVRAIALECHVGKWNEIDRLVERVYEQVEAIDILVNNAGMSPLYEQLSDVSEELFDKVIAVNYRAPFRLSALIGTRMFERGRGSIINVSSGAALTADPDALPYASAKAALNTLTEGFARAFAPKVRVNCIQPGPFMTDISNAWDPELRARRAGSDIGRGGKPEEVVGAALYFASDASSFTTGAILPVDGGATLRNDPK